MLNYGLQKFEITVHISQAVMAGLLMAAYCGSWLGLWWLVVCYLVMDSRTHALLSMF